MASTDTITIQVTNKSAIDQDFYLFQEKPNVSGTRSESVFTNAYGVAPLNQTDGTATFTIETNYYAVSGVSTSPAGTGVTIRQVGSKNVVLGRGTTSNATLVDLTTVNGNPKWEGLPRTIAANNGFAIHTDDSFSTPNKNNLIIGVGADDPSGGSGKVIVASVVAEPSKTYTFTPIRKFWICTGKYRRGEIADITSVGDAYLIDMTDATDHEVRLIYTKRGKFQPEQ